MGWAARGSGTARARCSAGGQARPPAIRAPGHKRVDMISPTLWCVRNMGRATSWRDAIVCCRCRPMKHLHRGARQSGGARIDKTALARHTCLWRLTPVVNMSILSTPSWPMDCRVRIGLCTFCAVAHSALQCREPGSSSTSGATSRSSTAQGSNGGLANAMRSSRRNASVSFRSRRRNGPRAGSR